MLAGMEHEGEKDPVLLFAPVDSLRGSLSGTTVVTPRLDCAERGERLDNAFTVQIFHSHSNDHPAAANECYATNLSAMLAPPHHI